MTNRSHEHAARQREQLLSFESVKRWMERETIRSNKTRIGYLDHLQVLLDRLGCNPDELVAQRIEDMGHQETERNDLVGHEMVASSDKVETGAQSPDRMLRDRGACVKVVASNAAHEAVF
jgi:hypothetical protein